MSASRHRSCAVRQNYIKRTNVFFIFQDIIKNEIKRLSAELTPINYEEDDEDNTVPSYYDDSQHPKRNTFKKTRFSSRAIIEYKYDGPFIIIDVRDRDESITFRDNRKEAAAATLANYKAATAAYSAAAAAAANSSAVGSNPHNSELTAAAELVEVAGDEMGRMAAQIAASTGLTFTSPNRRKTLLQRFRKSSDAIGNTEPAPPSRRERQMSFSLPERSLIEQSQNKANSKTYYDMLEKLRQKKELPLTEDERRQKIARIAAAAAAKVTASSASSESSASSTATAPLRRHDADSSSITSLQPTDDF
jgi:hypothetical protein